MVGQNGCFSITLIRVLKRGYKLAKKFLRGYSHPTSPHLYPLAQLACCVLLKIYRNPSYREVEEQMCDSNLIQQTQELSRVPDHTTIFRMMGKLRPRPIRIRRRGKLSAEERIKRQELVYQTRLDGIHGQRWQNESVPSVIKRKFGDTIHSILESRKKIEALLKGLVYNL